MQERTEWLLGDHLSNITSKTMMVIGVGGVGSYVVEMLARIGVNHLIIVDHDSIDVTNLNRQVMSLCSNIGKSKVSVWKKRISDIHPDCHVTAIQEFITKENITNLFSQKIDYVIDACDTVPTKQAIITYCLEHQIPFISSMGMANRIDSSKIKVSKLEKTKNDPLAKKLRLWARKEHIQGNIPVVYSEEVPLRQQRLGTIAHVPAAAGLCITNQIVKDCLKEGSYEK